MSAAGVRRLAAPPARKTGDCGGGRGPPAARLAGASVAALAQCRADGAAGGLGCRGDSAVVATGPTSVPLIGATPMPGIWGGVGAPGASAVSSGRWDATAVRRPEQQQQQQQQQQRQQQQQQQQLQRRRRSVSEFELLSPAAAAAKFREVADAGCNKHISLSVKFSDLKPLIRDASPDTYKFDDGIDPDFEFRICNVLDSNPACFKDGIVRLMMRPTPPATHAKDGSRTLVERWGAMYRAVRALETETLRLNETQAHFFPAIGLDDTGIEFRLAIIAVGDLMHIFRNGKKSLRNALTKVAKFVFEADSIVKWNELAKNNDNRNTIFKVLRACAGSLPPRPPPFLQLPAPISAPGTVDRRPSEPQTTSAASAPPVRQRRASFPSAQRLQRAAKAGEGATAKESASRHAMRAALGQELNYEDETSDWLRESWEDYNERTQREIMQRGRGSSLGRSAGHSLWQTQQPAESAPARHVEGVYEDRMMRYPDDDPYERRMMRYPDRPFRDGMMKPAAGQYEDRMMRYPDTFYEGRMMRPTGVESAFRPSDPLTLFGSRRLEEVYGREGPPEKEKRPDFEEGFSSSDEDGGFEGEYDDFDDDDY